MMWSKPACARNTNMNETARSPSSDGIWNGARFGATALISVEGASGCATFAADAMRARAYPGASAPAIVMDGITDGAAGRPETGVLKRRRARVDETPAGL